ncbi:hypothetical protein ACOI9X_20490 [Pseudomonas sp. P2757]|uniref:hypothetical protein n=1 Tax=unclassified Pseudomonas TaxID=196821 RepID=UPI003B5ABA93
MMRHRLIERAVVDRPCSGWFAHPDHRPFRGQIANIAVKGVARGMPGKIPDNKPGQKQGEPSARLVHLRPVSGQE